MPKGQLSREQRLAQNVALLKTHNARLRVTVAEQAATIRELKQQVETQAVQIAELQAMVFGKKPKPPSGGPAPKTEGTARTKDSYRRPIPPASAITAEEPVPLPAMCSCGGQFTGITIHDCYEEDIPLPDLTKDYRAHLVTKYVVERGICKDCGKTTSGRDLGGQDVTLGPNIRLLICHLVSVRASARSVASYLVCTSCRLVTARLPESWPNNTLDGFPPTRSSRPTSGTGPVSTRMRHPGRFKI